MVSVKVNSNSGVVLLGMNIAGDSLSFVKFADSFFILPGTLKGPILFRSDDVLCKDCARQKYCKKEKPPVHCERFIAYEDTRRFDTFNMIIRHNRGIKPP